MLSNVSLGDIEYAEDEILAKGKIPSLSSAANEIRPFQEAVLGGRNLCPSSALPAQQKYSVEDTLNDGDGERQQAEVTGWRSR